ncbi:MAG: ATP-binding cassette domain-containing protein [Sphingomonadales bacterium]|nr:ATP-binding cassette domain-containing protein [Sphingomonadales bacterium]
MTLAGYDLILAGRLNGVSLALEPGQVIAICGPNGAGKSSLLASLAGLIAPASGAVELEGRPLATLPPRNRARAIGYLPQDGEVAWNLSVETLVGLGRLPWDEGAAADRQAVETALTALDLGGLRGRPLSRLSGGERARALFARVLAGTPRWLLADEPLANLDLAHQQALLAQFRALAGQGLGVVLVLHDLALAMNHADRVIVLEQGAVAADGAPEAALDSATIRRVWNTEARWLGDHGQRALVIGPTSARVP